MKKIFEFSWDETLKNPEVTCRELPDNEGEYCAGHLNQSWDDKNECYICGKPKYPTPQQDRIEPIDKKTFMEVDEDELYVLFKDKINEIINHINRG